MNKEFPIIIRPSFMKLFKDGCQAALFNHIFYWIAWKNKDQTPDVMQSGEIAYFATNEELIEHMANVWSEKKIRTEVNALIDLGVIGKTKNPKFGADRTKHFFFGKGQYAKLIELCKKHGVCLAHIGLPKEVIGLLAAFSHSVHCPCTEQMVNLPNANGKFTECSEGEQMVNLPFANGKSTGAITKVTTKTTKNKDNERKNDASEKTSNVAGDATHSHPSIHSSSFSSSSEETKPTVKAKVVFSTEEQQIYSFAESLNLEFLKKDDNHKGHCAKLVNAGIASLEDMQRLVALCREKSYLAGKPLNLKNLVNELSGWLQVHQASQATPDTSVFVGSETAQRNIDRMMRSVADAEASDAITDAMVLDDIAKYVALYQDERDIEQLVQAIQQLQNKNGVNNDDMCKCLTEAHRRSGGGEFRKYYRAMLDLVEQCKPSPIRQLRRLA
jgi:hypothetical protein